ncbi:MAG TPA: DUF502 domain-containing protein [Clostridia bacterium]|nr:DUF502 domain-containing protein [Clostridia bacterium]HPQ47712.1 DUF502 domain-containing protein [Clostridia bacterium]
MKLIRKWFLSGIAILLPAGLTAFVLVWLFNLLDGILRSLITSIFGKDIPGLGLLFLLLIIFIVGMLTSNFVGGKIAGWFEKLVGKIPLIKTVYNPIRKITSGLSSDKNESFKKVVLIEFPKEGIKSIGFITNSDFSIKGSDKISVFIPTTPNPTNGFLVLADAKDVEILDVTVNEGLNMVVSMGSAIEGDLKTKQKLVLD